MVFDGLFQIFLSSDLIFLDMSCVFLDFLDFLDVGPTVQVGPLDPEETPASGPKDQAEVKRALRIWILKLTKRVCCFDDGKLVQ